MKRKGRENAVGVERGTSVAECFWLSYLHWSDPLLPCLFLHTQLHNSDLKEAQRTESP